MTRTLAVATILIAALALSACGRRAELSDLPRPSGASTGSPDAVSRTPAAPPRSTLSAGVGESLTGSTEQEEALTSESAATSSDPAQ